MPAQRYVRKLSRDDVRNGRILIDKAKWRLFPPPGQPFALVANGQTYNLTLDAEDCECVPPAHQHLHLLIQAFAAQIDLQLGTTVTFEKLPDGSLRLS